MLTGEELEQRRALIAGSPDLAALAHRLAEKAAPVITATPQIPKMKALLSVDGGYCPKDGTALAFDPWSPSEHRCPRCEIRVTGDRHDRAWARFQHLWLSERAVTLAALGALTGQRGAAEQATAILRQYADSYFDFPNRDNVLGPSRLFFSTYLESIWLNNIIAAATLLREAGMLDASGVEGVNTVADEAANLIGDFDEGFSNRQTWNNAALAAIAVWFEDEELATRAVEGQTGIVAHLARGFGEDGSWFEGENYHLFALRGQLLAMGWAHDAGADLLSDPVIGRRLALALRVPALTALPDFTFPARKDSRFGVSLAQPMYLELWEVGLARLKSEPADLADWVRALYASPAPEASTFDSYLHEAGTPRLVAPRTRADLSWWSLLEMAPSLPEGGREWKQGSLLLESQGLAILREGSCYASLECGPSVGGHSHADRLHLTLHAEGVHWLADPGTGSYVSSDLFWYRSTLAHNAPRLDEASQPLAHASCTAFEADGAWKWARGEFGGLTRTLVAGPHYLLDVVELAAPVDHILELPWHLAGTVELVSAGSWETANLEGAMVEGAEKLTSRGEGPAVLRATSNEADLTLHLLFDGDLLRAMGPGRPGGPATSRFYVARGAGRNLRLVAILQSGGRASRVQTLQVEGPAILVETESGMDRHLGTAETWDITGPAGSVRLAGARRKSTPPKPLIDLDRPALLRATALHVAHPPRVDGSLEEFDASEPIALDYEDQYRRSEEAYPGPEEFSATVVANWDVDALYIGVDVVKAEAVFRPEDAPPLRLDNEPDDIHSDGLQLYVRLDPEGPVYAFLIVPSDERGGIRVRPAADSAGTSEMVAGAWRRTETGYAMTLSLTLPGWEVRSGDSFRFDLIVNEMHPDRTRRAGQLVWTGGGGWVYLRGDRHIADALGVLELR